MKRSERRNHKNKNASRIAKENKIMKRMENSTELFRKLDLKTLRGLELKGKAIFEVDGKEIKFRCSSTDKIALHTVLKEKWAEENKR